MNPDVPAVEEELGAEPLAKLQRQRTQANAAAEMEESARRQEKQDGSGLRKKAQDAGQEGTRFGRKEKRKERRVVYVNLEGAATNPLAYERNKVRTSKYTLITFLPKVSPWSEFELLGLN
jgi:hypothetical protein